MMTIFSRLSVITNPTFSKVAIILLLSISSILFFNYYERFVNIGPELLPNISFGNHTSDWNYSSVGVSLSGSENGAKLHSDKLNELVYINHDVYNIKSHQRLRITFDIKTLNVTQGINSWMTARVIIASTTNNDSSLRPTTHILASLVGNNEWSHKETFFTTEANIGNLRIAAQLAKARGSLWIKNMSLRSVTETAAFRIYRITLAFLWLYVLLWIAKPITLSALRNKRELIVIVLALAFVFATLMPHSLKESINNLFSYSSDNPDALPMLRFDTSTFKFTPLLPMLDIFKAGHFFMFTILTIAMFIQKKYHASRVELISYLLLFSLVTEVLQLFVTGRHSQLGDLIIDNTGTATGVALYYVARYFKPPSSKPHPPH